MLKDKISFVAWCGFLLVILLTLIAYLMEGPFRMVLPFSLPFVMVLFFRRALRRKNKN